jgi:DNA-directed RNA polymerase subunit L
MSKRGTLLIIILANRQFVSEDSIRFMVSIYNIVFAKTLREEIVTLAAKHCYGCDVNHPSQAQHTCLIRTESEHLDVYLEEELETVFSGFVHYFDFWVD